MQKKCFNQTVSVVLSIILALAFLPVTSVYAAGTITSTTTGGDWGNTGTWVGGVVPSTGDSVIIDTGATVTLDGPIIVDGTLTINSGATFDTDITNNYALTVNSDFSNSGTFRARGSTITISGDFTMAAGTFSGATSTLNLNGAVTQTGGTFTPGTTVNYGSAGSQTVLAASYTNLTTSGGSGTKTIAGNVTILSILTVGAGTTFTVGAFNITQSDTTVVNGTLTHSSATGAKIYTDVIINSGGVWNDNAAAVAISFGGSLQNDGTLNAGTGTHTFTGTSKSFSGVSAISIANITITGTYTNNGTLTVGTALAGSGGLTQGASSTLNIGGTITLTTLTSTASPNTVNYNGAAQTIKAVTYHHFILGGSGVKTLTGLTTINGDLTLSGTASATTTAAAFAVGGDLTVGIGTTFTVANAITVNGNTSVTGTLAHSSATGAKAYVGSVTINSGGVWTNAGNSAITFRNGLTHNGSTFTSGSGIYTFDTNAQIIAGTSAISIANLTVTGITLTNNGTLTVGTAFSGSGGLTQGTGATLNITGTSGIATLVASASSNTVNYNGAAQTLNSSASTYHHLTLSGSVVKTMPTGLTTINGDLTLSGTVSATTTVGLAIGGNLVIGSGTTFTVGAFNITVTGTTTVNGTLVHSSGTGTKVYTGLVTISATHVWNNSGNANITFRNGLTHSGATFTAGTGVYTFDTNAQAISGTISIPNLTVNGITLTNNGTLTVSTALSGTGELAQGTSATLTITGSSGISTLTASANPNTVTFNGTAQTVNASPYYHLTTSGSGVKSAAAGDLTVAGNLTIGSGTTLSIGASNITVMGTTTVTGTLTHTSATGTKIYTGLVTTSGTWNNSGSSAITLRGGLTYTGGTFTAGTGIYTFDTNSQAITGSISIPSITVNGVTLTNNSTTLTVSTALSGTGTFVQGTNVTLNVGGVVDINTLTATASPNTVNYNSGAQTIKSTTYHHLTTAGSSVIKTLGGNVTVNGVLTIGATTTLDVSASNFALTLLGNWVNNGAFIPQSGTVTLQGGAAQTMSGVAASFNNITIDNSAGVTLSVSETVNGIVTFTNGKITTGTFSLIIGQAGSVTGANSSRYVFGNLQRNFATGSQSFTFDIGDATNHTPVSVAFASVTTAGNLTVKTTAGEHPNILTSGLDGTKDVNRYWTLTPAGSIAFTSYDATFNFVSGDVDGGANTANFVVKRFASSTWSSPTTGTVTSTSTQATGINAAMAAATTFAVGESDVAAPTVSSVAANKTNGSYTTGVLIPIIVTFNEIVNVTGTPKITLETGVTDRIVNYASGTGTTALTFNYTVQAGDTSSDLDYVDTASLALSGGTINDPAGNAAVLTLPSPGGAGSISASSAIVVDTTPPTVTNVLATTLNGTYKAADIIAINVVFSEVVNVTGTPTLLLETGTTDRTASYATGTGSNTLTFNYTVQAGDTSSDLNYVATNSLALAGGTIRDAALTNATLTLPATGGTFSLGTNNNIVIDTTAPTVTSVNSAASGIYKAADAIAITVTFSEIVNVTGTPQLTLETGTTDRTANYASGSGSNTLTFNYTVQAGDVSSNLDYVGTTSLTLNGGTITDFVTNAATLTLPTPGASGSLGFNAAIEIDTTAPIVTSVSSTTSNGSYNAGSIITVTMTFSEVVNVTGTPTLTLETGTTDQTINYVSGSGTTVLTFDYTVQAGDTSSDLDYVSTTSLALNGGTIKDVVTNDATLTLPAPAAFGSLGYIKALVVDTTAATVTSVSASTANGSYTLSNVIAVTVIFNEVVNVTGTPTLTLETGATDRTASYASGSGTATLTFNYTVQAGDVSSDLDYVNTTSLALSGGTIKDVATNNATLTLPAPGGAGSLGFNKAIVIDLTPPTVTNVSSTTANGIYKAANVVAVTVTFNELVNVTGTPQLTLETGVTDRVANYASGSGTTTLTFNYTVQAGDTSSDLDYVAPTSLTLNGGTIKDAATNVAILTLAAPAGAGSLGANKAIVIDTTAPDTQINGTPASFSNSTSAAFTFSSADGTATFECSLNGSAYAACTSPKTYTSLVAGSYTFGVRAKDIVGNIDATPASYSWAIDTTAPLVISSVRVNPSPTNRANVNYTVTFSEAVTGVGTTDFTITKTGTVTFASVASVSGSGTTYTITINTGSGDGTIRLDVVNDTTVRDLSNNALGSGFVAGQVYTINKTFNLTSIGANDGSILESSEFSNVGGTMNSTATTFTLGDDLEDKQHRSILHFNTASIPAAAVITGVTLKIKRSSTYGANPFTILGGLLVDIRKPYFGPAATMALNDFYLAASKSAAATFGSTPVSGWYQAILGNANIVYINRTGTTQFRLRFATDDNDNRVPDFIKFYSGNASASSRPKLVINYYIP